MVGKSEKAFDSKFPLKADGALEMQLTSTQSFKTIYEFFKVCGYSFEAALCLVLQGCIY